MIAQLKPVVLLFAFSLISQKDQAQDIINQEYSSAFIYILSDTGLESKVRSFFKKLHKKNERICYGLDGEVSYISPWELYDEIPEVELSKIQIFQDSEGKNKFKEQNWFKPENQAILEKLSKDNKAKLLVRFSKPVSNILLAEISIKELNYGHSLKMGQTLQIMFLFDENKIVEKIYCKGIYYN